MFIIDILHVVVTDKQIRSHERENHSLCKIYSDMPLEWVDFFSFQIRNAHEWIVSCLLELINGWGYLSYNISISYISTIIYKFFIAKINSSIIM